MEIGVLIPIGNNGWLIPETAPQYMPTFALNKGVLEPCRVRRGVPVMAAE